MSHTGGKPLGIGNCSTEARQEHGSVCLHVTAVASISMTFLWMMVPDGGDDDGDASIMMGCCSRPQGKGLYDACICDDNVYLANKGGNRTGQ